MKEEMMNGERRRLARGVWRPAKHIVVRFAWRMATFGAGSFQLRRVADGGGQCGARRAAPRPGRSRSRIIVTGRPPKSQIRSNRSSQSSTESYSAGNISKCLTMNILCQFGCSRQSGCVRLGKTSLGTGRFDQPSPSQRLLSGTPLRACGSAPKNKGGLRWLKVA
jgi:hypothetical protein